MFYLFPPPPPAPKEESKLRLTRKGSDGAVKRHKVTQSITSVPGVGVIETGTRPHITTTTTSGLPTPELAHKKATELESSSDSQNSITSSSEVVRAPLGLKRPGGTGLKKPSSGIEKPSNGFSGSMVKPHPPPTTNGEAGSDNSIVSIEGAPKKVATVEKKPSFSKLTRFGVPNKLTRPSQNTQTTPTTQATPTVQATPTSQATPTPQTTPTPQAPGDSNSSLDSTQSDIKIASSTKIDAENTTESEKLTSSRLQFKMAPKKETKDSHPRYGRRISPEGMSHDESTASTHDLKNPSNEFSDDLNRKNEEMTEKSDSERNAKKVDTKTVKKLSLPETGQSESLESPLLTQKQASHAPSITMTTSHAPNNTMATSHAPSEADNRGLTQSETNETRISRLEEPSSSAKQRARSLSPKSSNRIVPLRVAVNFDGSNSSVFDSTRSESSEDLPSGNGRSPLKSSLRGPKRTSSSSSGESSPARPKVVISPRSSQVGGGVCVYSFTIIMTLELT